MPTRDTRLSPLRTGAAIGQSAARCSLAAYRLEAALPYYYHSCYASSLEAADHILGLLTAYCRLPHD